MSAPVPPAGVAARRPSHADDESDDELPSLSGDLLAMLSPETRAALDEHLNARAAEKAAAEKAAADGNTEIGELFGMSQFWYTDESADNMARAVVEAALATAPAEATVRVACISAPSCYKALKRLAHPRVRPFVLEFDRRFAAYGPEFVFYDFNAPAALHSTFTDTELGGPLRKNFDAVIADPPYLNEECMSKTGETIRLLAKSSSTPTMFNTGAILCKPIGLMLGLRPCATPPKHRVSLMNPFLTYTNFETLLLGGWSKEDADT